MYLKEGYFDDDGPHPADDIGQGYLTTTVLADELPQEILKAAKSDPTLLEEFKPDETLIAELATEIEPETFRMYRNDEVAFDGLGDTGYMGYGLDIAFSEMRGFALVAYSGPSLPTIVRRYACTSADEAVALWQSDWSAPLIFTVLADNDNELDAISRTFH